MRTFCLFVILLVIGSCHADNRGISNLPLNSIVPDKGGVGTIFSPELLTRYRYNGNLAVVDEYAKINEIIEVEKTVEKLRILTSNTVSKLMTTIPVSLEGRIELQNHIRRKERTVMTKLSVVPRPDLYFESVHIRRKRSGGNFWKTLTCTGTVGAIFSLFDSSGCDNGQNIKALQDALQKTNDAVSNLTDTVDIVISNQEDLKGQVDSDRKYTKMQFELVHERVGNLTSELSNINSNLSSLVRLYAVCDEAFGDINQVVDKEVGHILNELNRARRLANSKVGENPSTSDVSRSTVLRAIKASAHMCQNNSRNCLLYSSEVDKWMTAMIRNIVVTFSNTSVIITYYYPLATQFNMYMVYNPEPVSILYKRTCKQTLKEILDYVLVLTENSITGVKSHYFMTKRGLESCGKGSASLYMCSRSQFTSSQLSSEIKWSNVDLSQKKLGDTSLAYHDISSSKLCSGSGLINVGNNKYLVTKLLDITVRDSLSNIIVASKPATQPGTYLTIRCDYRAEYHEDGILVTHSADFGCKSEATLTVEDSRIITKDIDIDYTAENGTDHLEEMNDLWESEFADIVGDQEEEASAFSDNFTARLALARKGINYTKTLIQQSNTKLQEVNTDGSGVSNVLLYVALGIGGLSLVLSIVSIKKASGPKVMLNVTNTLVPCYLAASGTQWIATVFTTKPCVYYAIGCLVALAIVIGLIICCCCRCMVGLNVECVPSRDWLDYFPIFNLVIMILGFCTISYICREFRSRIERIGMMEFENKRTVYRIIILLMALSIIYGYNVQLEDKREVSYDQKGYAFCNRTVHREQKHSTNFIRSCLRTVKSHLSAPRNCCYSGTSGNVVKYGFVHNSCLSIYSAADLEDKRVIDCSSNTEFARNGRTLSEMWNKIDDSYSRVNAITSEQYMKFQSIDYRIAEMAGRVDDVLYSYVSCLKTAMNLTNSFPVSHWLDYERRNCTVLKKDPIFRREATITYPDLFLCEGSYSTSLYNACNGQSDHPRPTMITNPYSCYVANGYMVCSGSEQISVFSQTSNILISTFKAESGVWRLGKDMCAAGNDGYILGCGIDGRFTKVQDFSRIVNDVVDYLNHTVSSNSSAHICYTTPGCATSSAARVVFLFGMVTNIRKAYGQFKIGSCSIKDSLEWQVLSGWLGIILSALTIAFTLAKVKTDNKRMQKRKEGVRLSSNFSENYLCTQLGLMYMQAMVGTSLQVLLILVGVVTFAMSWIDAYHCVKKTKTREPKSIEQEVGLTSDQMGTILLLPFMFTVCHALDDAGIAAVSLGAVVVVLIAVVVGVFCCFSTSGTPPPYMYIEYGAKSGLEKLTHWLKLRGVTVRSYLCVNVNYKTMNSGNEIPGSFMIYLGHSGFAKEECVSMATGATSLEYATTTDNKIMIKSKGNVVVNVAGFEVENFPITIARSSIKKFLGLNSDFCETIVTTVVSDSAGQKVNHPSNIEVKTNEVRDKKQTVVSEMKQHIDNRLADMEATLQTKSVDYWKKVFVLEQHVTLELSERNIYKKWLDSKGYVMSDMSKSDVRAAKAVILSRSRVDSLNYDLSWINLTPQMIDHYIDDYTASGPGATRDTYNFEVGLVSKEHAVTLLFYIIWILLWWFAPPSFIGALILITRFKVWARYVVTVFKDPKIQFVTSIRSLDECSNDGRYAYTMGGHGLSHELRHYYWMPYEMAWAVLCLYAHPMLGMVGYIMMMSFVERMCDDFPDNSLHSWMSKETFYGHRKYTIESNCNCLDNVGVIWRQQAVRAYRSTNNMNDRRGDVDDVATRWNRNVCMNRNRSICLATIFVICYNNLSCGRKLYAVRSSICPSCRRKCAEICSGYDERTAIGFLNANIVLSGMCFDSLKSCSDDFNPNFKSIIDSIHMITRCRQMENYSFVTQRLDAKHKRKEIIPIHINPTEKLAGVKTALRCSCTEECLLWMNCECGASERLSLCGKQCLTEYKHYWSEGFNYGGNDYLNSRYTHEHLSKRGRPKPEDKFECISDLSEKDVRGTKPCTDPSCINAEYHHDKESDDEVPSEKRHFEWAKGDNWRAWYKQLSHETDAENLTDDVKTTETDVERVTPMFEVDDSDQYSMTDSDADSIAENTMPTC